ncbi:MAG TPA: hypothetical protein VFH94_17080 [Streptomyces sp.]|nr:hypothetical protein [Streptomyces sp.]
MITLILIGVTAVGAVLVFGSSPAVVGITLMAAGALGLFAVIVSGPGHRRPGEKETVVEERHYFGGRDDHHPSRR